ncbi:MAG: hypothetical protein AAGF85_17410 [Bacteroidota bacterium]
MKTNILLLAIVITALACEAPKDSQMAETIESNPAVDGFNTSGSDSIAVAWADACMKAMGGRQSWDQLNVVAWNFFGARDLIWEKSTGRVRIDFPRDSSIYLVNINTMEGKVWRKGEEVTQADSLKKYLNRAKSIWINDSYWLVMPFKLKDTGVTLNYLRSDTTLNGVTAEVLQLTFENVGDTPQNKYEVFIDVADSLVKQWSYFRQAEQDSASAIWPWDNYQSYNGLLLSANRSDNRGPKNLRVYDEVSDAVFESFEVPELE